MLRNDERKQKQNGFTFVELLVVIAIIGLLASVVLLALNSARAKSRDAKRLAEARAISTAQVAYFDDQLPNAYATDITSLVTGGYLQTVPSYPQPIDGNCSLADYGMTTTASSFEVTFCLGNGTGNVSEGTHTFTEGGLQ